MVKKSILAVALITSLSGPLANVAFAGDRGDHRNSNNRYSFSNDRHSFDNKRFDTKRFDKKWTKGDDGGYKGDDGGFCVPEMDAGFAALGIGLTLGLVAFMRDRKRS